MLLHEAILKVMIQILWMMELMSNFLSVSCLSIYSFIEWKSKIQQFDGSQTFIR